MSKPMKSLQELDISGMKMSCCFDNQEMRLQMKALKELLKQS